MRWTQRSKELRLTDSQIPLSSMANRSVLKSQDARARVSNYSHAHLLLRSTSGIQLHICSFIRRKSYMENSLVMDCPTMLFFLLQRKRRVTHLLFVPYL